MFKDPGALSKYTMYHILIYLRDHTQARTPDMLDIQRYYLGNYRTDQCVKAAYTVGNVESVPRSRCPHNAGFLNIKGEWHLLYFLTRGHGLDGLRGSLTFLPQQ